MRVTVPRAKTQATSRVLADEPAFGREAAGRPAGAARPGRRPELPALGALLAGDEPDHARARLRPIEVAVAVRYVGRRTAALGREGHPVALQAIGVDEPERIGADRGEEDR